MSRFTFFDEGTVNKDSEKSVLEIITPETLSVVNTIQSENAKYRVEQMVITKLNGIVQSHAVTKRDFIVERHVNDQGMIFMIKMLDNIININPESLKGAIELMMDVDILKSDVTVKIDTTTGKISNIINHSEIIEKWNKHKEDLEAKYSFLRADGGKLEFLKFVTVAQHVIINESNLIEDLNTKLFFDLFFDKYLVSDNKVFESYSRPYYSQLFDGEVVSLNYEQTINAESTDKVNINRTGSLDPKSYKLEEFIHTYDEKFKPMVQYKFSNFDVRYREQYVLNTTTKWIETSEITIIEEVKNNVEIITDYKLRRIE